MPPRFSSIKRKPVPPLSDNLGDTDIPSLSRIHPAYCPTTRWSPLPSLPVYRAPDAQSDNDAPAPPPTPFYGVCETDNELTPEVLTELLEDLLKRTQPQTTNGPTPVKPDLEDEADRSNHDSSRSTSPKSILSFPPGQYTAPSLTISQPIPVRAWSTTTDSEQEGQLELPFDPSIPTIRLVRPPGMTDPYPPWVGVCRSVKDLEFCDDQSYYSSFDYSASSSPLHTDDEDTVCATHASSPTSVVSFDSSDESYWGSSYPRHYTHDSPNESEHEGSIYSSGTLAEFSSYYFDFESEDYASESEMEDVVLYPRSDRTGSDYFADPETEPKDTVEGEGPYWHAL